MSAFLEPPWLDTLATACAADEEFAVGADRADCRVGLLCPDVAVACHLTCEGMSWEVNPSPLVTPWRFAFASDRETWDRFLEPVPPPLHHDIFALISRVPAFRLLGDPLVLMQHIRLVQRWTRLFRQVSEREQPS